MKIDLSTAMMQSFDIKAEYNPPELLHQISNYAREDFSPQDWNRINYFKGKALYTMNQYKQANDIAMECIRESVLSKDYYTLVKGHILQGVSYYNTDSEDLIKPLFEMAAEYAIESADYELMISVQCAFLFYYRRQSQFEAAFKCEHRIIDLIKRVPPSYTCAGALGSIASLYIDLSKWDATIKYYTLALDQARELALEVFELSILNNLGSAICRLNDYPKAEMILNQGLVLARKMGHQQQVFLFTSNLGNLKIQEQQYWEAIRYYDTCMGILENVAQKPPLLLIDLYNNYSMCYWKLNRQDKSLCFIDKAIEIARDNGFERDLVQMEVNKTNLLVETGDYDEALKIVKRGIAYYKSIKDLHQLIWVHRSLSRIHFLRKNYKKSYETDRKLDKITDKYIVEIQGREIESQKAKIKVQDPIATGSMDSSMHNNTARHGFIGRSKASQAVISSALLAAQHPNTSVMILGESGTGKEIIAQLIHKNSVRRNQIFVPVNVGALSSSLIESELFGHTKGAYTGADSSSKGFFLQADKGTIFLDEISDMPYATQSKLLRTLETRKVTPVGSSKELSFDSRIISATSQDIRTQLSNNHFRLDLFHRLNTIEIIIPPLRERLEDIEPILSYFLRQYSVELNKSLPIIDKSLLDLLYGYQFPGNVRELKNIVERMYILCHKSRWDAELLCEINPFSFAAKGIESQLEIDEEDAIVKALIKTKGKQKEAARLLNMSEATLSRRIIKYKLQQHTNKNR